MLYGMNNQLEDLMERAEEAKKEKNRAAIATANAEIRRGKNYLREELPKLRKLMSKKSKGVTDEMRAEREQEVADFEYKIECVPDGGDEGAAAAAAAALGGRRRRREARHLGHGVHGGKPDV